MSGEKKTERREGRPELVVNDDDDEQHNVALQGGNTESLLAKENHGVTRQLKHCCY